VDLLEVEAVLLFLEQVLEVRLYYQGVVTLVPLGELDLLDNGAAIVMAGGRPTIGREEL
jgi:hypothetical protein